MKPFFSVIIPTYNRPDRLAVAVQSVVHQTFTDWELIVVDDGSTPPLDRASLPLDDRIQLISKTNAGPGAARRYGVAQARGRYFCFLDDDDYFFPDHLSILKNTLKRIDDPAAIVLRTSLMEDKQTRTLLTLPNSPAENAIRYPDYQNDHDTLLQYWQQPCGITSLCFSQRIIERVPIDPAPRIIEDFAWLSRVFTDYSLYQIAGPPTVAYVQHAHNRTLTDAHFLRVEERLQVVESAYQQPGVALRVPRRIYRRLLQHQLCHAARQCLLAQENERAKQYFWRAFRYGPLLGWRDLLGVGWLWLRMLRH
ncbi:MAG: glycosyltransferase [Bacteroidota bacterium]